MDKLTKVFKTAEILYAKDLNSIVDKTNEIIDVKLEQSALSGYAKSSSVNSELAKKQDALSSSQLNAANSGITKAKVNAYDGYGNTLESLIKRIEALEAIIEQISEEK